MFFGGMYVSDYIIEKLKIENYHKCNNIWDMHRHPDRTVEWGNQLESGEREVYVCVKDNEYVGEIAFYHGQQDPVYTIIGRRVYISRMIVKEELRNQGIGALLLDFMCDLARERGYTELSLGVDVTNLPARHLYKKKGFTKVLYHGTDKWGEFYKLLKRI